jgi:hypothetical protein
MSLTDEQLRKLIDSIVTTHQDDPMDCETCNRELGCLAEKVAAGARLRDLLPEVEFHLQCCQDCFEEFQALVCILQAEQNGQLAPRE